MNTTRIVAALCAAGIAFTSTALGAPPRADAEKDEAQGGIAGACPSSGNCYATHATPGCEVAACCNSVCAVDGFCCNNSWDSLCVGEAIDLCTNCGDVASSCFANHGPGCQDEACCAAVCGIDAFCCDSGWDSICINEAWNLCAPENETCGDAIPLITDVPYYYNTTAAITDGDPISGCEDFGDPQIWKDVWFTWTATCDAAMTVSTCGTADYDTKLAIYGPGFLGGSCPAGIFGGVLLACNDDFPDCDNNTSKVTIGVNQGVTYKIRAGGYNNNSGTGTILVTCNIPNDLCEDLVLIYDGNTPTSNIGAHTDGPTACLEFGYDQIGSDIWYRYASICTGSLLVSTCNNADYDTKLAVYGPGVFGDSCPGLFGGILLGCNDDFAGCSGNTSEVRVGVQIFDFYRIRLGGYLAEQGHATLTVLCCPGDFDANGVVDGGDLGLLLGQWGTNGSTDMNGDGIVDGADLGLLLGSWGACS